jgi:hypothetical protein
VKLVILNLWKANKISDIAALKRVSADLILIKVGQGKVIDDLFEENFKLLTENGFDVGVFYFVLDKYSAKESVETLEGWLKGKRISLMALDAEPPGGGNTVSEAGMDAFRAEWERLYPKSLVVYSNQLYWQSIMNNSANWGGVVKWVANPGADKPAMPTNWSDWGLWQFAFNQTIEGVTGGVDLNYYNTAELAKIMPFVIPQIAPVPEPSSVLWRGKVMGTNGLYVRNMPATSGKVLRGMAQGTICNVYQVQNSWARISPDNPEWCYIASDCLSRIPDAPIPVPDPIVTIPAGSKIDIATFPCFSQNDPRWRYKKLGTSSSTLGGWGCVVTSNASVYKFLGFDTDPDRLNTNMIKWQGYQDTNMWRWWTPPLYMPDLTWEREPSGTTARARIDLVRKLTEQGIPPILCVDFDLRDSDLQSHFVVGLGVTPENDVIIMDSWDGKIKSFKSTYGNPLWGVWRVDIYRRTI